MNIHNLGIYCTIEASQEVFDRVAGTFIVQEGSDYKVLVASDTARAWLSDLLDVDDFWLDTDCSFYRIRLLKEN